MEFEALIQSIGLPLIMALVPILVGLFKKSIPSIPKWALPILAGVLGAPLDQGIALLTGMEAHGVAAVVAGLAGVGLREVSDQSRKALAAHKDASL